MGRRWIGILTALGVLGALLAVTLPVGFRIHRKLNQRKTATELAVRMAEMEASEVEKQRNLVRWYNRNLTIQEPEPNFREAYESILNLGEGMLGLLEVPELKVRLAVSHGSEGAAAHDPSSALPIGGQGNHTVIYLDESYPWSEGLRVYVEIPGQRLCYRVQSAQVMPKSWSTDSPPGEELLTLVYDGPWTRTLVRCVRCQDLTVKQERTEQLLIEESMLAALGVCSAPLALCLPERLLKSRKTTGKSK